MLGNYLVRGLMIGLIFGVPAGAIGALTIQRTLSNGFSAGLVTGLGSSAADLLYACVGVFGMTLVSGFLTRHLFGNTLLVGGAVWHHHSISKQGQEPHLPTAELDIGMFPVDFRGCGPR